MQSDNRKSISIDQRNLNNEHAKLQNREIKIMIEQKKGEENKKEKDRTNERSLERAISMHLERENLRGLYRGRGQI